MLRAPPPALGWQPQHPGFAPVFVYDPALLGFFPPYSPPYAAPFAASYPAMPPLLPVMQPRALPTNEAARPPAVAPRMSESRPPPSPRNPTSRFTGVSRSSRGDRKKVFKAVITINKKQKFLGYFVSEEEAARAYDAASIAHRGSHAKVNFAASLEQCLAQRREASAAKRLCSKDDGESLAHTSSMETIRAISGEE